jgi:hypothetical protein
MGENMEKEPGEEYAQPVLFSSDKLTYFDSIDRLAMKGYARYEEVIQDLQSMYELNFGYIFLSFENLLRLQLQVVNSEEEITSVLTKLWLYIDAKTQYFTSDDDVIYEIPKHTRRRDHARFKDGSIFSIRHLNKALVILNEFCTQQQLREIILDSVLAPYLSLKACIGGDLQRILIREREVGSSLHKQMSTLMPTRVTNPKTGATTSHILALVEVNSLLRWLKEIIKARSLTILLHSMEEEAARITMTRFVKDIRTVTTKIPKQSRTKAADTCRLLKSVKNVEIL